MNRKQRREKARRDNQPPSFTGVSKRAAKNQSLLPKYWRRDIPYLGRTWVKTEKEK